ncbi:MAG: sigma-E processing peptidase SpoIIGA [Clostridia bacterium]|nr:sigma-E processing peptidase SpoIIGA [Clostridia bacterium]
MNIKIQAYEYILVKIRNTDCEENALEIYLDVLFLENIVMNYLILLMTSKLSKNKPSHLRLFLGALVGASYVIVLILLPGMKVYYTTFAKIALSFLIIAVAFSPEKIAAFFKTLAIFYISTFIFAGAAFTFLYFNQSGGFVRNGVVYVFWQSKWTFLVLSIALVGIIARIFFDVIQYKLFKDKLLMPLNIAFDSKVIKVSGLVDTGNSLKDPLSRLPVIVVEFEALKEILPLEIQDYFKNTREHDLYCFADILSGSPWTSRFRLIPFTSLGMENGMLIGFIPDYVEIGEAQDKKGIHEVVVGIYNKTLSKNERYRALLNPELVG